MAEKRHRNAEDGHVQETLVLTTKRSRIEDGLSHTPDLDTRGQGLSDAACSVTTDRMYAKTSAEGSASVIQGDVHGSMQVNHYHAQNSSKDSFILLRDSLAFPRIGARVLNIDKELANTCQWLFTHEAYIAWKTDSFLKEHHGFLWIKGKPGCGKSTIMRMIFERATRAAGRARGQAIVSYFFNGRAYETLEKSGLGLFRDLTRQILDKLPALEPLFVERFAHKTMHTDVDAWTETELKGFLIDVVSDIQATQLHIFVDALDEGEEQDIRRLVTFFEDLARRAAVSGAYLRVCFSSRHYPHISIRKGRELIMEEQTGHADDLRLYVTTMLVDELQELGPEILGKADGVFLWVCLVIPILQASFDKGNDLGTVRLQLEGLPPELDDLFAEILKKYDGGMDNCMCLLQWVLLASRPLSAAELYLAVQFSFPNHRLDRSITEDKSSVQKYLLENSRGLVLPTKADPPVMQFIHETVRTFLLSQTESAPAYLNSVDFAIGAGHTRLRDSCFQYIDLKSTQLEDLKWLRYSKSDPNFSWNVRVPASMRRSFPFLEYACQNMLHHANEAQRYGVPQTNFILDCFLVTPDSVDVPLNWIRTRNCFEKFATRRFEDNVPLLYVLADQDFQDLARILIEFFHVNINAVGGRYGNALQAACAGGHQTMTQMLIEFGAQVNQHGGEHKYALCAALHHKNIPSARYLLKNKAHLDRSTLDTMLIKAITRGDVLALDVLIDLGVPYGQLIRADSDMFDFALRKRRWEILFFLYKKYPDELVSSIAHYRTALRRTASTIDFDGFGQLLKWFTRSDRPNNFDFPGNKTVLNFLKIVWNNKDDDMITYLMECATAGFRPCGYLDQACRKGMETDSFEEIVPPMIEAGACIPFGIIREKLKIDSERIMQWIPSLAVVISQDHDVWFEASTRREAVFLTSLLKVLGRGITPAQQGTIPRVWEIMKYIIETSEGQDLVIGSICDFFFNLNIALSRSSEDESIWLVRFTQEAGATVFEELKERHPNRIFCVCVRKVKPTIPVMSDALTLADDWAANLGDGKTVSVMMSTTYNELKLMARRLSITPVAVDKTRLQIASCMNYCLLARYSCRSMNKHEWFLLDKLLSENYEIDYTIESMSTFHSVLLRPMLETHERYSLIQKLVKVGADVNLPFADWRTQLLFSPHKTPLSFCVGSLKSIEILQVLLEAGADAAADCHSAWQAAFHLEERYPEFLQLLRQYTQPSDRPPSGLRLSQVGSKYM